MFITCNILKLNIICCVSEILIHLDILNFYSLNLATLINLRLSFSGEVLNL